jgi:hypothetical protein
VYTRVAAYDLFLRQAICSLSDFPPSYCVNLPTGEGTFTRQDTGNGGGGGGRGPTGAPVTGPDNNENEEGRAFCAGGVFTCLADIILWLFSFFLGLFKS